jgi:ferritin-like metal-binding protein YciE
LKAALQAHLKETEGHVTKLEQVFKSLDQKAKGKTCGYSGDFMATKAEAFS